MMRSMKSRLTVAASVLFLVAVLAPAAFAQGSADPNECDTLLDEPDVIVGDLQDMTRYGSMDGMTSFSVGTTSCNVGSCWLEWDSSTNRHPVIGQSLYRLQDGRIEQIGQSWLKHGFFALSQTLCSNGCIPTNGDHLGVDCSDPYTSGLNGSQSGLGPKFQVNPYTGDFSYPFFSQGQTGNMLYKRVQVDNDDLDPGLNAGARYFVEGQYVTPDDAAAGNGGNNNSHREVWVQGSAGSGFYDLTFNNPGGGQSQTVQGRAAVFAWRFADSGVLLQNPVMPGDGQFWIASKASDNGDGTWTYEIALQNITSNRGAKSIRVPLGEGTILSNIGFGDIDYHSGEPTEGTDWSVDLVQQPGGDNYIEWSTEDAESNADANALLWGTTYNFRFDADTAPEGNVTATIGAFRAMAGEADSTTTLVKGPAACLAGDTDADTFGGCIDCDDSNGLIWGRPGEVSDLLLDETVGTDLSWSAPTDLGGTAADYRVLRSATVVDFVNGTDCIGAVGTTANDTDDPTPGTFFAYLVMAENSCPTGAGSLGQGSSGQERLGRECP